MTVRCDMWEEVDSSMCICSLVECVSCPFCWIFTKYGIAEFCEKLSGYISIAIWNGNV